MNAYYFDSDIMIFDTGLTLEYQKFSMKKRETTLEACCINAATCCCHNQGMNVAPNKCFANVSIL